MALNRQVRAAGGVLRRVGPDGMEVLLVHRPRYRDWTFPKGKAHDDETDEETALREVEEETGLRAALGVELPSTNYIDLKARQKRVRYWTMRPQSGSFEADDEVDEVKWLSPADAESELSYSRDLAVLRAVPPPLLVVRHASAGDQDEWEGDDARRPLDERGEEQANALVEKLAGFPVERILSSPYDRCVQTVEPLARARGLEVETSKDLAEDAGPERLGQLLRSLAGEAAVLSGHGGPALESLFGKVKKAETVVVEAGGSELHELGRIKV